MPAAQDIAETAEYTTAEDSQEEGQERPVENLIQEYKGKEKVLLPLKALEWNTEPCWPVLVYYSSFGVCNK